METIQTLWFWLTRYMVAIEWEGQEITHWAKTEREALEWLACYPDGLGLVGKRGKLIAARWSEQ